jgi:two-component system, chemotaxis family, sensor kinase CheA
MGLSEDIRRQLIEAFKAEQADHVQNITQGLLSLEKTLPDQKRQAILDEIFREAHSLKGGARAVGMGTVEALGHAIEDLLLNARDGRLTFTAEFFDLLYQALDAVTAVISQLESGNTTPSVAVLSLLAHLEEAKAGATIQAESDAPGLMAVATATAAGQPAAEATAETSTTPSITDATIRVSVSKLDALMGQLSELLGARIRSEQRLLEVRQTQAMLSRWNKEWLALARQALSGSGSPGTANGRSRSAAGSATVPLTLEQEVITTMEMVAKAREQLRSMLAQTHGFYRRMANDNLRLSLIIDEMQEELKRVRMLPLDTITSGFGRMVRDMARQQNKEIDLFVTGAETELDKRVLEQVKDPLIHLLRNAVDHGLESLDERRRAGKPAKGRIDLSAGQQGSNIVIRISDDGQGLNLPTIRRAAVRRGLLSAAEAELLTDEAATNLIFHTGLSTSAIITDISGRGIGLDVVRQNVEQLHGTLQVTTEKGEGATFTLTLPLTLSSTRGLLLQTGNETFMLPHAAVERMLKVKHSDILNVAGKAAITHHEKTVILAWLSDLLEFPAAGHNSDDVTVVIIAVAEKRLGLVVDSLEGEQEIVIKSLGKPLAKVSGIAGATISGSGQVILVLHPADLIKLAARSASQRPVAQLLPDPETRRRKSILVVDDSITTRILEKNILESAGYLVETAIDGDEALSLLITQELPDLIVTDINMPGLDGLALTQRLKGDERFREIPIILVTSLGSPADKARGIEVGADAYIVKSSFDQGNLLSIIEQLI